MAIQAAVWRANLEERALPELIQDYAKTTAYRPAPEAVDLQRKWLASANSSADVDSYFRALIYSLGDNNVLFRSLSSDSMSQIAVVAAVAGRGTGTGELKILDLAAGSGSMLVSLGRAAEDLGFTPSLRGSEISPEISVLAASGLFLSQMESVVRQADSLIQDPFDTFAADLAVSQPPFGLSWRNVSDSVRARQSNDNWYNLGLPDTGDSTWLFASRLIEKLQDPEVGGGRAVTFCTLRSLISPSASQLREQLLNRDLLESVILLPSGITETARPLCGLVFNNLKASKRHGRVQIVDLRAWIQQSHLRTAPKRLRPEALLALSDALDSPRDGVISRTVRRDYFLRTRVGVAPDNCDHNNRSSVRWEINLPREEQVVAQLSSRYGPVSVRAKGPGKQVCDIIFNDLFDSAANHVHKWLRINNFPVTRLSALLTSPPILLSKDDAPPTDVSDGLLLPTSPSLAAKVATEDPEREGMNPALLLSVDSSTVVPEYLAAWLNSALGIESRESASQLQVSATGLPTKMDRMGSIRFCDAILVPLPPMTTQHEFINTELRLSATNNLVNAARREVWATPARMKEIRQQFEPLFDQSLEKWIDNLPYPVASAFWYLQTSASQSTEAAHRQIFGVGGLHGILCNGTSIRTGPRSDPARRREAPDPPGPSAGQRWNRACDPRNLERYCTTAQRPFPAAIGIE